MRKLIILLLLQGYLMAVTLLKVDVNGTKIPVIFEKDNRLPLASIEFIFRDSGVLASNKAGLVSLSANLLNEGTKKDGSMKFAKELEDNAIEFSVNSGNETFVFTLESLKEKFNFGLDKVIELINDPNYTENAFNSIVTKRRGVLARKADDFDYIANNGLKELLFPNTPLANPKLGTVESIKSIKLEDLKEFINTHLYRENLIVVVGGDFNESEVKEAVKKFAKNLKSGEVKKIAKIKTEENNRTKEVNEDTQQAYIYFGAPYYMEANDTKRVIGKVASFILGSSGFGSRLMEEIRVKRGLAYSAYSRFIVNKTNSHFFGYLQTKLENQDEAISVVKDVVGDFLKSGATEKELDGAKKFFLGSEPLRSERLMQRLNRAFNEYYSGLGIGFSEKELKVIENLTLEELNSFIKEHQEIEKMSFFIVTNKGKKK
jgi:predicted Zn-dependent peptidase